MSKPLGVKEVINPLPATGGADKETRDQARRNVPLAVKALDRLVSVQDYADFARTFAGIGKASAARLSDGRRQVVHVTIAGAEDIPIDKNSDLYRNLRLAFYRFGEPQLPVVVKLRELALLVISARVRLQPDYLWEAVEPKVRSAMLGAFSFERRELGQDVLLSEVISVIQNVPGVAFVDVELLDSIAESVAKDLDALADKLEELTQTPPAVPNKRLVMEMDRVVEGEILPAQLAFLSPELPETLILEELPQ
jgi:predicted phage baseplate assembly protein